MCHEAAHRLGTAGEGEANLSAFLACSCSDDVRLSYSGCYSAFNHCVNALLAENPKRAQRVVSEAPAGEDGSGVELVLQDRTAARQHYQAYKGPFEDVGTTANDTYLTGALAKRMGLAHTAWWWTTCLPGWTRSDRHPA